MSVAGGGGDERGNDAASAEHPDDGGAACFGTGGGQRMTAATSVGTTCLTSRLISSHNYPAKYGPNRRYRGPGKGLYVVGRSLSMALSSGSEAFIATNH